MLEHYYVRPGTADRIRSSWIGKAVEEYVAWLRERAYSCRSVLRRVPLLIRFGDFARGRGAAQWEDLPDHVEPFVKTWVSERTPARASAEQRKKVGDCVRNPIRQMLRLVVPGYVGMGRPHQADNPFEDCAPRFFEYLRDERGLREETLHQYRHCLRQFAGYLQRINLRDLRQLSPPLLSAFVAERSPRLARSGLSNTCGVLRVFLRYLHRERVLAKDLSRVVEHPQSFRLSGIPRSISWDDVRRVLEGVDRRSATGRRDYAILLLLVTYGLRAREVAALTLDDIDWRNDRLRVPERKAGHSTAYPLSAVVGEVILDYLKNGRPQTQDRHLFFRGMAPLVPIGHAAISSRAGHYLRKAGISIPRAGSHTLRHTCVQRLVDADFPLKSIGDYVGHRVPASTQIYSKVAIETLRQVALGDGEEAL
jgi:site-specific recombinase XerD